MQILCTSADMKCPWEGQRDQLDGHLSKCAFDALRYIITPLMTENEQLKELIGKFHDDNQQLRDQTGQLAIQANKYQREIQDINQQLAQLKTQLQNQEIKEQERHRSVWEYIDGDNFDAFLRETGVGMATRLAVKCLKPCLIIDEFQNEWMIRFEKFFADNAEMECGTSKARRWYKRAT
ncbi:unnamed protein product [Adineta ricciae]|uniref:TRAF-type domain-containing protein n=1 Tax=Adineta ricciae TaxID=249248 RepID=A0A815LFR4_ADIRI|nr:unnamed protein product [Adineta ricciae]CAF1472651.1 unnamed protein product [Adineta ricciae]